MDRKPRIKTGTSILLGHHLASLRKRARLSLRDVAKSSDGGISDSYLSQIENGWVQFPHPLILRRLARLYGTSYHQMIFVAYPGSNEIKAEVEYFSMNGLTGDELAACQAYLLHFRSATKGRA